MCACVCVAGRQTSSTSFSISLGGTCLSQPVIRGISATIKVIIVTNLIIVGMMTLMQTDDNNNNNNNKIIPGTNSTVFAVYLGG